MLKSYNTFLNESSKSDNNFVIKTLRDLNTDNYYAVNKRWGWHLVPKNDKEPQIIYYGGNDPVVKIIRVGNTSYEVSSGIIKLFTKIYKEVEGKTNESYENKVYSQEEMSNLFIPLIETEGNKYKKTGKVEAEEAKPGEHLVTYTADGKETENTAKEGDWKIKNIDTSGEEYFISGDKFKDRYVYSGEGKIYLPTGECEAIKLSTSLLEKLNFPSTFEFMAPWGEKMIAKKGDYLATTDGKEIYRIAEKEFYSSYSLKMYEHKHSATFFNLIKECVPGTGYNHFLFSDKPLIFEQTLYDNVEDYHLGEIGYFRGIKPQEYDSQKILNGLYYTTVGRGILSQDTKNKIINLAERLVNIFPEDEIYKEVLNKANEL